MKKKEKILILVLIAILAVVVIIKIVNSKGKEIPKDSVINVNDVAYQNKNIYVKNGDIIVEEENGGKTIETKSTVEKTDLKEASTDIQNKYEISNVVIKKVGTMTKVTGSIKNNDNRDKKVQLTTKFYKESGKIAGSCQTVIDKVKVKETQAFEMSVMGDFSANKYKIEVEFTN